MAQWVVGLGDNITQLDAIITSLQTKCNSTFSNHSQIPEREVCDGIVKGLLDILPMVDNDLINKLAWDSSNLCRITGFCTIDCCLTSTTPEQVHLALPRDPSAMNVMWTTLHDTEDHIVEWGTSEDNLNQSSVSGSSSTYTYFGWRGMLHHARMTQLLPSTTYFYRVGSPSSQSTDSSWSSIFSFKTLKTGAGTSEEVPLRVASVGDMGYGNLSNDTINRLTSLVVAGEVDMVIHNGDISYADGEMKHWDNFMRKIEPIASRVPYQVTPGNHEFWFNFSAYNHRFRMPDEGVNDNHFYSFSVGQHSASSAPSNSVTTVDTETAVSFVAMDTESSLDVAFMSAAQIRWLEKELAVARNKSSWVVAYGHRPLYCSNRGGQDIPQGNTYLRKAIEQQLYDNRVDLVIQAHVHDYERTYPVFQEKMLSMNYTNAPGPVYVVNGAAGNRELNDHPPGGQPWIPASLNRSNVTSFGVFKITPQALVWRQIVASDGSELDSFTLTHV
jgi:3',5'-cyclic AMP phosphodiesterase CpdA